MKHITRTAAIGASIVLLAVLIALYVLTMRLPESDYLSLSETLGKLQRLDSRWSVELVKVAANPQADFDSLAAIVPEVRARQEELRTKIAAVPSLPRPEANALRAFAHRFSSKSERVERFKSGYSIVRNSRRFLPIAASDVSRSGAERDEGDVGATVDNLLKSIDGYLSEPNDVSKQRILLGLGSLQESIGEYPRPLANAVSTFLAHAAVLLDKKGPMDELLREATGSNLADEAAALDQRVGALRAEILATKERYQIAMLVVASLMLVALTVALVLRVTGKRAAGEVEAVSDAQVAGAEEVQVDVRAARESAQEDFQRPSAASAVASLTDGVSSGFVAQVLLDDLDGAGDRLRSHARLLREVSHEWSTGLQELRALTSEDTTDTTERLMRSKIDDLLSIDASEKLAAGIRYESGRIIRVVNELTRDPAFARSSGEEWVNVNDCLDAALAASGVATGEAIVQKRYAELPPIFGTPEELTAAFFHILTNSRDALGEDPEVRVKTEVVEETVAVTIVDNGAGMNRTTRKSAFSMFFSSKDDGRGLGLNTARVLLARAGGSVSLNSMVGRGTAVRVLLPLGRDTLDRPSGDQPPDNVAVIRALPRAERVGGRN